MADTRATESQLHKGRNGERIFKIDRSVHTFGQPTLDCDLFILESGNPTHRV